jgi:lysophospholipase L1-like esterase
MRFCMNRRTRRSLACLLLALSLSATLASHAQARDALPCAAPYTHPRHGVVQRCPLVMPGRGYVPVHGFDARGRVVEVGRLNFAGSRNWFVCQTNRPGGVRVNRYVDSSLPNLRNGWWARTLSDDRRWGWVNEIYFAGAANDERDVGLRTCETRPTPAPTSTPAPSRGRYVALGDSYSSGVGAGAYYPGPCQRSMYSYPPLLAARMPATDLDFRACGGNTVSEMTGQLDGLTSDTVLVTVTAGGNDLGFGDLMRECWKPFGDCSERVADAERVMRNELPQRLANFYAQIRSRAPRARLVVVGYPGLLDPNRSCSGTFNEWERAAISRLANELAGVIERATRSIANAVFADSRDAFAGHLACGPAEWIKGPSFTDAFHPNRAGYEALVDVVARALG